MTKVFVINNNEISSLESLSRSSSITSINLQSVSNEEEKSNGIKSSKSIEKFSNQQELKRIKNCDPEIPELEKIDTEVSQSHTISTVVEHPNNETKDKRNTSLALEEAWDNLLALQRNEMFKSIILNISTNFSLRELFLLTLGTIFIGVTATLPFFLDTST